MTGFLKDFNSSGLIQMAVILIAVAVMLFFIMRIFLWQKIKDRMGMPGVLKVNCLRFCEDMAVRTEQLSIKALCVQTDKELKAWHHIPELYVQWIDGKKYLPVSDRDGIPIDFFGILNDEERKELSDGFRVAEAAADYVGVLSGTEETQNRVAYMLIIVVGAAAILLGAFAIKLMWGGGA